MFLWLLIVAIAFFCVFLVLRSRRKAREKNGRAPTDEKDTRAARRADAFSIWKLVERLAALLSIASFIAQVFVWFSA